MTLVILRHMALALVTRGLGDTEYEIFSLLGGRQTSASQHNGGFAMNTKKN